MLRSVPDLGALTPDLPASEPTTVLKPFATLVLGMVQIRAVIGRCECRLPPTPATVTPGDDLFFYQLPCPQGARARASDPTQKVDAAPPAGEAERVSGGPSKRSSGHHQRIGRASRDAAALVPPRIADHVRSAGWLPSVGQPPSTSLNKRSRFFHRALERSPERVDRGGYDPGGCGALDP